jgi:undecaprenyl-phosphate galactose phosphotransferase/putative colanic acid biosynthesis UDP-glucose lipid carrier transferase
VVEVKIGVEGRSAEVYKSVNLSIQQRNQPKAAYAEAVAWRTPRKTFAPVSIASTPFVSLAMRIIDGVAVVVVSIVSGVAYHELALHMSGDISDFFGVGTLMAVLFTAIAQSRTSPETLEGRYAVTRASDAALAWVAAFLLFVFISFLLKFGTALSRGATLTFFFTGIATVVVCSVQTPKLLARLQLTGAIAKRSVILVGSCGDSALERVAEEIRSSICPNPLLVTIDAHCPEDGWATEQRRIVRQVFELARTSDPGEILLASQEIPKHRVESLVQGLTPVPRSLFVIPDDTTVSLLRNRIVAVGTGLAVEVQREPLSNLERFIKRGMDILFSTIFLICLSPVFAIIAIGVKLDSSGPVFFSQRRLGYRGRVFKILKFRTMTTLEDGSHVLQAHRNDQRVTRLGRWLRRTSLDELPQLINVLIGDMSLVGPRPHAAVHDKMYVELIEHYEIRQHVKPGITGWAQVHGLRGETPAVELMSCRVELDLWYAKNASIRLDCQILYRTIFEVLRQRNAY